MTGPTVEYPTRPVPVRFLARPNRFLALVERRSDSARFAAHVPNPGRMAELLRPGRTVGFAVPVPGVHRRTRFDLVAVCHGPTLVSIDSQIANRLIARALREGALPWAGGGEWRAERPWGAHRFDFALANERTGRPAALLEVKSSNLRDGRTALFPDAPTERGRRHLEALTQAAHRGLRAVVVFALQRSDVRAFAPNRRLDPGFAEALDRARASGVEVHAVRLRIRPGSVELDREVPLREQNPTGPTQCFIGRRPPSSRYERSARLARRAPPGR